ncbi:hypothetical protein L202_05390 [Cryptococcus amylolentus CBS 6039]|uniref:Rab proteins geranylgeranyltransferase n=1 Tax=Cryptococcus amylolentus CBS 6039 TaxID=1295533 RepID=A0A1E3HKD1_9TREE|nr:hypothetical protein L202_05390 [Cryptococcus amylolentus CBS 6039]ODN76789.1 hypothetical protein L202_05390 [Cryptococcus amylolentus CBS 6039]
MANLELESDSYDVVVIGTGVSHSIAAAALAKAGKTVLHLDPNDYYGGDQASLTLDELSEWIKRQPETGQAEGVVAYSNASATALTPALEADRRRYSLSLFPALIPSRGRLIETLISSDVGKYVSFKLLDSVSIWNQEQGAPQRVPGSKEDVFKDKSVTLLDKRKLMKFLLFAAGDFEESEILKGKEDQPLLQLLQDSFGLSSQLAASITYAIAHCESPNDKSLPSLIRTRRYLRSIGRYGPSSFLVGQYGGAGEVAQGYCRGCAVFGGTYVLGSPSIPTSCVITETSATISVPCHPRPVTANHIIASTDYLTPAALTKDETLSSHVTVSAHCIAITSSLPDVLRRSRATESQKVDQDENDDTSLLVFPPEGDNSLVRCLINGEGTGSCPAGQYIIYLYASSDTSSDPSALLRPYLHRLSERPTFEAYYTCSRKSAQETASTPHAVVLRPYPGKELLTEGLDWEAQEGERVFYEVMGRDGKTFFESEEADVGDSQDE